jgi:Uma2 family endonuclease
MAVARESILALLEETDGRHELYEGELREKPPMSFGHNRTMRRLVRQLITQLPEDVCDVLQNAGHTAIPGGNSYIPDVAIVPASLTEALQTNLRAFESYSSPLLLVVEIWSPSTGTYDVDRKIPGYQQRGDLEIWRVHPFNRVVTIWRRQDNGRYVESEARGGTMALHALPDVTIDLDALLA